MGTKREKWMGPALALLVLGAMLLFFERAHPLVILDADDWTYISQSRTALPSTRFWNPARILPELLMPYGAGLGVLLFGRLGYIQAITAMNGLILSLFITAYVLEFYLLLRRRLGLRAEGAALLSLLFLLLHFLIFRSAPTGNVHLFRANDVTCVYYYVIPGLLNAALVLRLARTEEQLRFWEPEGLPRKAFLVLAVYLAIFSNLFASVLLAAWCGLALLGALLRLRWERRGAVPFLREQGFHLAVLLLWLLSVAFEGGGERGQSANPVPFGRALADCLGRLPGFFGGMNRFFLLLAALCLALGLFLALRKKRAAQDREDARRLLLPLLLTGALVLVFELLLCAKVASAYIARSEVLFGFCFCLLAPLCLTPALALRRWPRLLVLLPLLLLILYSQTDGPGRSFTESNDILAPAELCTAMDEDLVEQVLAAERAGERRVTVYVADNGGGSDNWPQTVYMGPRVAASLYKHGVTERLMEIEIVPSAEWNARLHVMEDALP